MEKIFLPLAMLLFPALFSTAFHIYLIHEECMKKTLVRYYLRYLIVINAFELFLSWIRGVHGLHFANMTLSYKMKYLLLGIVIGAIIPFCVCTLLKEHFTFKLIFIFFKHFLADIILYFDYAIKSAKSDLNAEVKGSMLDWLWWMIEPFCTMIIYTVIFGYIFKSSEPYFAAFIFIGITMWGFFSRSINGAVGTVRAARGIITKIYLPKYILLLSKMFVNAFKMMVSFAVTLLLMLFLKVPINWTIICFGPIIVVLFLFTFGVGTIMMHYGVYVNDLGYITGIVLNILMYMSGPFYNVSKRVPAPFGEILENYNPIAFLMAQMRNALLYGTSPNWGLMCLWAFISLMLIALGCFTIYHNENAYVKVI